MKYTKWYSTRAKTLVPEAKYADHHAPNVIVWHTDEVVLYLWDLSVSPAKRMRIHLTRAEAELFRHRLNAKLGEK